MSKSKEEPLNTQQQQQEKKNRVKLDALLAGLPMLEKNTLKQIFYVNINPNEKENVEFMFSPDFRIPHDYGSHYSNKHPLLLLKKEFLDDREKLLFNNSLLGMVYNTTISGNSGTIRQKIDYLIELIQNLLLPDEELDTEFIQKFVDKRANYTETDYMNEKEEIAQQLNTTFEALRKLEGDEYEEIENLLRRKQEPEAESKEKTTLSKPRRWYGFLTRKYRGQKLKSRSKSKSKSRSKSRSRSNTVKKKSLLNRMGKRFFRRTRRLFNNNN